jgi:hypothetical protein
MDNKTLKQSSKESAMDDGGYDSLDQAEVPPFAFLLFHPLFSSCSLSSLCPYLVGGLH